MNLAMIASKVNQEESEANGEHAGLAYKDMKDCHYYGATIFLFLFEAGMAIAIPDVDIMFNFVSAIAASCLGFCTSRLLGGHRPHGHPPASLKQLAGGGSQGSTRPAGHDRVWGVESGRRIRRRGCERSRRRWAAADPVRRWSVRHRAGG